MDNAMEKLNQITIDPINNAYELITTKLLSWVHKLIIMVPNLLTAIIVLFVFYVLGRLANVMAKKILSKTSSTENIIKVVSKILYFGLLLTGVFFALGILQLDKTVTSLLAGAGIMGLALSFAFQDLATNFISGFMIAIKKPLRVGDVVETNGFEGTITTIDLRAIHLKTFQGQNIIIPSKDVLQKPIKNFATYGERRIDINVGISYSDDIEKAIWLTKEAVERVKERDTTKDVEVYCDQFADSSINLVVRFWINLKNHNSMKARNDALIAIHKTYNLNKINIPYPIRTLDIGLKAGEKLTDLLSSDSKEV